MSWLQWIALTITSSAGVGLIVRHLTTAAITHAFQVEIEKLKFTHTKELQHLSEQSKLELEKIKGEIDLQSKKEIEYIKAEISLYSTTAANAADKEKATYMTVANVRATSYPKLVALLRRMKRQFEGLAFATGDETEARGPVNLSNKSKRADLVKKALDELAQLEKEFDDELSNVRLFTTRSYYYLQSRVQAFCREWGNKRGMFSVTEDFLRRVINDYNDDISFLSEEFYRPEISIGQSGERLGYALAMARAFPDEDEDKIIEEIEGNIASGKSKKQTFSEWLVERRPGAPMIHKS
jgi:hypothetical protein